jgi:ABC-2 type transport system ATP-binding protein
VLNITCEDENINKVINLFTKYNIKEFNNIKETLEDYFMHFYKEDKEFGGNF